MLTVAFEVPGKGMNSHIRIVPFPIAPAILRPLGLNATLKTGNVLFHVSVCLCSPVVASQRRMLVSELALAIAYFHLN